MIGFIIIFAAAILFYFINKCKQPKKYKRPYSYCPDPANNGHIVVNPPVFRKTTYEDMLLMKQWKDKAKRIKERDGNKCVYCGSTDNLQVHHKYYSKYPNGERATPWNYPDDALITLCDKCHKAEHEKRRIKTYYRKYNVNFE